MRGDLALPDIVSAAFPGFLVNNAAEGPAIREYFNSPNFDFSELMRGTLTEALSHGEILISQSWLCQICLTTFLREHAMNWWLERKRAG